MCLMFVTVSVDSGLSVVSAVAAASVVTAADAAAAVMRLDASLSCIEQHIHHSHWRCDT
jgi:hypothetical protein